jgi:pyrroloquinoline quinone (PQQ) biosynthesis protein C
MGGNVARVRDHLPSAPVQAMIAFNYFCAERAHPCSILGMLYSLEVIASVYAATLSQSIAKALGRDMDGPGFKFLLSHSSMDQDHVAKLNVLVKTIDDPVAQESIVNATRVNFYQFGRMFYENGFTSLIAD